MLRLLLILFLLGLHTVATAATTEVESGPWVIEAIDWARPRHGEWLVQEPALAEAMDALQRHGGSLEIRYPGGDSGSLWAGELRAWLVALGLASEQIQLRLGAASAQQIELYRIPSSP